MMRHSKATSSHGNPPCDQAVQARKQDFHPADTVVSLGGKIRVGGKSPFLVIAGPAQSRAEKQLMKTARFLKKWWFGTRSGGPISRGRAAQLQGLRSRA
jgi:3-deoxy-D-arabino-heptulosonate 7-phosphate (DAHP) synthase